MILIINDSKAKFQISNRIGFRYTYLDSSNSVIENVLFDGTSYYVKKIQEIYLD